jgi:hypothetical protein
MKPLVLGTTAVYARTLASRALTRIVAIFGALLMLVGLTLMIALHRNALLLPYLVLAVPAGLVLAAGLQRFNVEYQKARAGIRAEARTARRLNQCGVHAVVHGVLLGHGDIDHVVLGPCIAAVETKHGRGVLSVDSSGVLLVAGRRLKRDPIAQSRQAAERLTRHLGRRAYAVVVIVDAEGAPVKIGDVYVTSLRYLPTCIDAIPAALDAQAAQSLARTLPTAG